MTVEIFFDLDRLRSSLGREPSGEKVVVFKSKASARPWAVIEATVPLSAEADLFLRDLGRFAYVDEAIAFAEQNAPASVTAMGPMHCLAE